MHGVESQVYLKKYYDLISEFPTILVKLNKRLPVLVRSLPVHLARIIFPEKTDSPITKRKIYIPPVTSFPNAFFVFHSIR